jgi:succinoglycan biosynthesis transport protein ExoP
MGTMAARSRPVTRAPRPNGTQQGPVRLTLVNDEGNLLINDGAELLASDDIRLSTVGVTVRRQIVLVLVVTAVITAAVAAIALSRTPQYSSTASDLVRSVPGNPLSPATVSNNQTVTVAMQTEAGLVHSPNVVALVNKKLGTDIAVNTTALKAVVPSNTEIVAITFTASTSVAAQRTAQAFAEAFLTYRGAQATASQKFQLDSLKTQITSAQAGLKKASDSAASSSPPPDAGAQVQLYANRLASLQDSVGQLQVTDTNPGEVVTPAPLPTAAAGLSPVLLIVGGAFIGLACGIALAIWRERRFGRVQNAADLVVAGLPILTRVSGPRASFGQLLDDPRSEPAVADAYRRARAAVVSMAPRPARIAVCDADGAHSSGVIALNLGVSLAKADYRVVVIDAAVGSSSIADLIGVDKSPGLSDALVGRNDTPLQMVARNNLSVVLSGELNQPAREALSGPRMVDILDRLSEVADYIIIATPSAATPEADAVMLASDHVILVVSEERTTQTRVAEISRRVHRLGTGVLGIVTVALKGKATPPADRPVVVPTSWPKEVPAPEGANAAQRVLDGDDLHDQRGTSTNPEQLRATADRDSDPDDEPAEDEAALDPVGTSQPTRG